MRNSSIIVSIIGLSILVSGIIAAAITKNATVATVVALLSLALIGSAQLISTLSTPSESDILREQNYHDDQIRAIYDRMRVVENECESSASNLTRLYDLEIDSIHRRIDECNTKRK